MMLSNKMLSLGIAGALSLAILSAIPNVVQAINAVEQRQARVNLALQEWKAAYQALLPVNDVWNKTYTDASRTNDLVELIRAFRLDSHNFAINVDTIVQTSSEAIMVNGEEVGLRRLCIGNGSQEMVVQASNMSTARQGLRDLAKRNDIEFGDLFLSFDEATATPVMKIRNLCLRVRSGGEA